MRHRVLITAVGVSLALAVASCATLEREEVAAPADGGAVAMRVNAALVVNLPADASGGNPWVLRAASPNLTPIGGPDVTPAPKPPGLVGVADTTTFRFRATATGDGTLEFASRAPSAPASAAPDRVVRYAVSVGSPIGLASDFFGTVGMHSARPAGNSTMGVPTATGSAAAAPGSAPPATAGSRVFSKSGLILSGAV